jgi:hypothetical protein
LHRVGRRLGFRLVTDSASSLSIGTGLAGTTTLPIFVLPRFWSCYRSPRGFPLEVRPFALEGICFQPSPAQQEFNSPLVGAPINWLLSGRAISSPRSSYTTILLPMSISTFYKERKGRRAPSERPVPASQLTPFCVIRYDITFFAMALVVPGTTVPLVASPDREYQRTWEPQTPP